MVQLEFSLNFCIFSAEVVTVNGYYLNTTPLSLCLDPGYHCTHSPNFICISNVNCTIQMPKFLTLPSFIITNVDDIHVHHQHKRTTRSSSGQHDPDYLTVTVQRMTLCHTQRSLLITQRIPREFCPENKQTSTFYVTY